MDIANRLGFKREPEIPTVGSGKIIKDLEMHPIHEAEERRSDPVAR